MEVQGSERTSLSLSGRTLPQPPEQQQKRPCPEVHLLLLRGSRDEQDGAAAETEPWAAAVPPEWVPIIQQDIQSQRKVKPQPP